jgi:hypothetical protein
MKTPNSVVIKLNQKEADYVLELLSYRIDETVSGEPEEDTLLKVEAKLSAAISKSEAK